MPMADHKIEISFLQQMVFESAHNRSGVPLTDLRDHYANGETAPGLQRASEVARAVFVLASSSEDAVFGPLGD